MKDFLDYTKLPQSQASLASSCHCLPPQHCYLIGPIYQCLICLQCKHNTRLATNNLENSHDSSRMPYAFGLDVALSRPKTDDATTGGATATSGAAPAAAHSALMPAAPAPAGTAAARQVVTDVVRGIATVPPKPNAAAATNVAKPASAASAGAKP